MLSSQVHNCILGNYNNVLTCFNAKFSVLSFRILSIVAAMYSPPPPEMLCFSNDWMTHARLRQHH